MRSHPAPEPLEARIAPAALIALDKANHVFIVDPAHPDQLLGSMSITGLQPGETLVSLDTNAIEGRVYALGLTDGPDVDDTVGRLYALDLERGEAIATGDPFSTMLK